MAFRVLLQAVSTDREDHGQPVRGVPVKSNGRLVDQAGRQGGVVMPKMQTVTEWLLDNDPESQGSADLEDK